MRLNVPSVCHSVSIDGVTWNFLMNLEMFQTARWKLCMYISVIRVNTTSQKCALDSP